MVNSTEGKCESVGESESAPAISVVAPVWNEGVAVRQFINETVYVLETIGVGFELVLVDDGSTDDSWHQIVAANESDERIRGIALARNFGKEAAMLAGIEASRSGAVIVMDSDLQHPPEVIPSLIEAWRNGADVVEAVKRTRPGQGAIARASSRLFNRVFKRLTAVDLTDATDYRLLSRAAVDALLRMPERTFFFRALSTWIGFNRDRVYFDVTPRAVGASKWRFRSLLRYAINGITSFTAAPLHLVTVGAVLFGVFSIVLGVQTLVLFLQGGAVTGFTTVILILLLQGTFVLAGLSVVGEYIARIHDEVKRRPRFIVGQTTYGEPRKSTTISGLEVGGEAPPGCIRET